MNDCDIEKGPLVGKTVGVEDYGTCTIVEQSNGHVTLEIPSNDVDGTDCRYIVVPERELIPNDGQDREF